MPEPGGPGGQGHGGGGGSSGGGDDGGGARDAHGSQAELGNAAPAAGGGGDHIAAAPNPAPVTTATTLADLTVPARSYNNAIDQADNFNDSFGGFLAGLFGVSKKASETVPGQVDTTLGFNPVDIALNFATGGVLGTIASKTGLTDFADIEAVNFNDLPSVSPGYSRPASRDLFGGSGNDNFSGGSGGFSGDLTGYGSFGASLDGDTGQSDAGDGLTTPAPSIFASLDALDLFSGDLEAGPDQDRLGPLAAQAGAGAEPSILPELVAIAALGLELA